VDRAPHWPRPRTDRRFGYVVNRRLTPAAVIGTLGQDRDTLQEPRRAATNQDRDHARHIAGADKATDQDRGVSPLHVRAAQTGHGGFVMPDLKTQLEQRQAMALRKATLMLDQAEREGRGLTPDEEQRHAALLVDIDQLTPRIERAASDAAIAAQIDALVPLTGPAGRPLPTSGPYTGLSLGAAVMKAGLGDWLKANPQAARGSSWRSPTFEVPFGAATLTEDPASGGALVIPDTRPGIQPLPMRRPVVADLLAQAITTSNAVTYMRQTTFTNAADTVAEGAVKPESTLAFDSVTDPVRKIAHWLPVTEELVDDVPAMRSFIDAQLRLGVELVEDDQLLNGTTTAPDIVGIRNRTGLAAPIAVGAAPDTAVDAILRQMSAIYTATNLAPDGVVLHPDDWLQLQSMKLTDGSYIGTGPFIAPQAPTLWGMRVVVTPIMTLGTALVGAFGTAAMLFRRGGLKVEISASHADFWIKNLLAVRAELREALIVSRPAAFGEVTGI
jgi:HK97 family phage major capsid protein